jgi:hypothetical protein
LNSVTKRTELSFSTGSLTTNQSLSGTLDFGCKTYALYSITSDASGSWVRLYHTSNDIVNDASRTIEQDPPSTVNLMFETFAPNSSAVRFSPTMLGYNNGSNTLVPYRVTNLSPNTTNFTITFNYIKVEL